MVILLIVFDRWGEVVFETDKYDPENPETYGWDGKAKKGRRVCPNGTYTWMAIYKNTNGEGHKETGAVTILR